MVGSINGHLPRKHLYNLVHHNFCVIFSKRWFSLKCCISIISQLSTYTYLSFFPLGISSRCEDFTSHGTSCPSQQLHCLQRPRFMKQLSVFCNMLYWSPLLLTARRFGIILDNYSDLHERSRPHQLCALLIVPAYIMCTILLHNWNALRLAGSRESTINTITSEIQRISVPSACWVFTAMCRGQRSHCEEEVRGRMWNASDWDKQHFRFQGTFRGPLLKYLNLDTTFSCSFKNKDFVFHRSNPMTCGYGMVS